MKEVFSKESTKPQWQRKMCKYSRHFTLSKQEKLYPFFGHLQSKGGQPHSSPSSSHTSRTHIHTAFLNFCATHFTSQGQVYELQCKIFPWKYEKSGGLCDSCLRWIQSKACFSESWYGKKWVFRCWRCCWELILNGERARVEPRFLWNFTIFPKIRGHIIIDVFLMKDTCFEIIITLIILELEHLLKISQHRFIFKLYTLGYESLDTPKKLIQKRRTLFCFYSRLDNNQGGCQHFHTQVYYVQRIHWCCIVFLAQYSK